MKRVLAFAFGSIASGALFCLALPPSDLWFFGWLAFTPLFAVVKGQRFLVGFAGGLLSLFTTAFLVRSGVFYADKAFVGTDAWIFTGCGLFGFTISILAGVWADKGSSNKPWWWFAALAVSLESVLLLQLPAHLSLTQYRHPAILFLSSIGGIWLASFLVWAFNLGIANWLRQREARAGIAWLVVYLAIWVGFYSWKLFGVQTSDAMQVGMIQTDSTDERTLGRLQMQAAREGARLVVWPEFAGITLAPGGDTKELRALAAASRSAIVTSFNDRYEPLPHNAAALMTASETSPFYYKRRLFGGEKRMHTPGRDPMAVSFSGKNVGLNICFDSCYPSIIRDTSNFGGVEFVALPTIDPESPHRFIASIHAAFTPFRAAENGMSIVRADGYAHSMAVLPNGQIAKELEAGEAVGVVQLAPPKGTLYRAWGDWFLYLCYGAVAFGAFRYRTKKVDTEEERLQAFAQKTLKEKGLEDLLP